MVFLMLASVEINPSLAQEKQVELVEVETSKNNVAGEQGFPDMCKIPVSLYVAIFVMCAGIMIFMKS